MEKLIKHTIKRISHQKIAKSLSRAQREADYKKRIEKRTGLPIYGPARIGVRSRDWFDPIYCARNANSISKVIWRQIEAGTYAPKPTRKFEIKKKGGGTREIHSFSIPDAAVAKLMYRGIVRRNIRRFSASSFAYLPDRDIFDAILSLRDFDRRSKIFATQIDFEKFFDRIPHQYLNRLLESNTIHTTRIERSVLRSFMTHESTKWDGSAWVMDGKREIGTPQGSAVSLVLANLANHELDRQLSLLSGKFVRYADDVVALSNSYEQALSIEHAFFWHCDQSGLTVNKKKSPGISAFSDVPQEIRTTGHIDFLGYRFRFLHTELSPTVEKRIRSRLSKIVNLHLIHYTKILQPGPIRAARVPMSYDWDLLGLISELRKSIYGGNTESEIVAAISRGQRIRRMWGVMSHYHLVDDPAVFKRLDGWLLSVVCRAMRARRLLRQSYALDCPTPTRPELLSGVWLDPDAWRDNEDGEKVLPELRFPSFVRAWKASRLHFNRFGIGRVPDTGNGSSQDLSDLFEYPF
ncbi:hypothetical protein EYE35_19515 [Cereibacter sphaeroides]|nr:hypothetical protein EYE35_19515 [Cereibacter sphaeroides]